MKILMLSSFYEPYAKGGAERAARTLAAHLPSLGHEVVVLTVAGAHETGDRIVDGIRVRAVPLHNIYDLRTTPPAFLKSLWHVADTYNPAMQREVARVMAEERPDVVHTELVTGFSASAWVAADKAGVPVVHTLHDHYVLCARSTLSFLGVPCERRHLECVLLSKPRMIASKTVTHVVGVSSYILEKHREFEAFRGVPGSVIPNPCHLVTEPAVARSRSDQLRFGFMGRIERWKGIHLAIEAMGSAPPNSTLSVAGDGPADYVAEMRALAAGRPVTFVGTVNPASFLREIDVMIIPSTGLETFGLTAAEALAMGVPVIASSRGALPELVKPGRTGWIFDVAERGALSKVMHAIAADRDRLAEMAAECRQSVQHCDPSAVATAYSDLYETVARRRATPR